MLHASLTFQHALVPADAAVAQHMLALGAPAHKGGVVHVSMKQLLAALSCTLLAGAFDPATGTPAPPHPPLPLQPAHTVLTASLSSCSPSVP